MTTRHVSNQVIYPFFNTTLVDEIKGILDLYLVVMGEPDLTALVFEADFHATLVEVDDQGSVTQYTVEAYKGFGIWRFQFVVPHIGDTGQVGNSFGNDSIGTLIFNTQDVYQAGGTIATAFEVEPSRLHFHTEQVNSITFQNVCRVASVEDFTELRDVAEFTDISPFTDSVVIPFEDGYNTIVQYEPDTDTLSFTVEQGEGRGTSPDYGDVAGCGSSSSGVSGSSSTGSESSSASTREVSFVRVINGLIPNDGNIPINVTPSLSLSVAKGRVEILIR